MKKKVLIVSTNKFWTGISRLPGGLSRTGNVVYALCPRKSFISHTKFLEDSIQYPTFSYSRSKIFYLLAFYALFKYDPDTVLPGDEEALLVLQKMHSFFKSFALFSKWQKLLEQSIPSACDSTVLLSKSRFIEHCHQWKIPAPKNIQVQNLEELLYAGKYLGYPVVLKLDEGYGGSGVFICQNEKELSENFLKSSHVTLFKKLKIHLKRIFFISLFDKKPRISLQQFVKGITGHVPFCAKDGKLLAANPMLKIQTYPGSTGPTSVSSGFNDFSLIEHTRTLVEKLSYNGFGAIDFMVDEQSQNVFVIEINPRPTPSCHFSSELVTYDLCEAFTSNTIMENKPFKPFTVAMFPNEKKRDPNSPFIQNFYYDIPHDDPFLMNALDT